MATKAPSNKGRVVLYSVLGLGGVALAYWLYTKYEANAAAGTTSGTPSTSGSSTSGTPSSSPTTPITTIDEWKAAILKYMVSSGIKGGENTAATALTDALSGHCLGPNEFTSLNSALGSIGQPPGGQVIVLSQCKPTKTPTQTHTPSENPPPHNAKVPAKATPTPSAAATNRANNAAAAARRRANDLAAAARRRAANRTRATHQHRLPIPVPKA